MRERECVRKREREKERGERDTSLSILRYTITTLPWWLRSLLGKKNSFLLFKKKAYNSIFHGLFIPNVYIFPSFIPSFVSFLLRLPYLISLDFSSIFPQYTKVTINTCYQPNIRTIATDPSNNPSSTNLPTCPIHFAFFVCKRVHFSRDGHIDYTVKDLCFCFLFF